MFRKVGAPDFRKEREREKEGEDSIQQTNKFGSINVTPSKLSLPHVLLLLPAPSRLASVFIVAT